MAETTTELQSLLEAATWVRSQGYRRTDGFDVGGHEYVLGKLRPDLHQALLSALKSDPAVYVKVYGGFTYRYLNLGGWKYWTAGYVVNRERVPDDG